jgi:hypothetical protein
MLDNPLTPAQLDELDALYVNRFDSSGLGRVDFDRAVERSFPALLAAARAQEQLHRDLWHVALMWVGCSETLVESRTEVAALQEKLEQAEFNERSAVANCDANYMLYREVRQKVAALTAERDGWIAKANEYADGWAGAAAERDALREALRAEKKITEYANHTASCFAAQAHWWNTLTFEEISRTLIPCVCGLKVAFEARAALGARPHGGPVNDRRS